MAQVSIGEAKLHLDQLIERALAGEEIVLTLHGEPAVRIVPERQRHGFASLYGVWRDQVVIGDDFDQLPETLAKRLGGSCL